MAYVTFGYNYTLMDGQMLLFRLEHNAMVRDYNMVGSWGTIGSASRAPSVQLPNGDAMVSMSHYQAGMLACAGHGRCVCSLSFNIFSPILI